jgi:hypothetical protein
MWQKCQGGTNGCRKVRQKTHGWTFFKLMKTLSNESWFLKVREWFQIAHLLQNLSHIYPKIYYKP